MKSLYSQSRFPLFAVFFYLIVLILGSIFCIKRYDTKYLCRREGGGNDLHDEWGR